MWVDKPWGQYIEAIKFLLTNKYWKAGRYFLELSMGSTWWEWSEGSIFFSGGGLSNSVGTSGMARSSVLWDHGPVFFSGKEWREMTTWLKISLGN